MPNESLFLPGPAGRIEALLATPEVTAPRAAAVVCHAHPQHGGMMHFKVVFRAAKALQAEGIAVLRFNFRGVGLSEGAFDNGIGEQDDVRAALDAVEYRFPGLPLLLGGFSFGSSMALRVAASDSRVKAVFALGFPVAMLSDRSFVDAVRIPRLFVQGGSDRFGDADAIRGLVARLPEPKSLVVLDGADHFFTGQLDALGEATGEWAALRPWLPHAAAEEALPS